jgi:hypothetical protein
MIEEGLSRYAPGIMTLRVGDNVTARVRRGRVRREIDWLWELKRDGGAILSYEETRRYIERQNARTAEIAHWEGVLSLGFFVAAILLRRHFGAWRDATTQSAPASLGARPTP